jgi:bifunctional enzyme CysN/CysC
MLDGDAVRRGLSSDLGLSAEDRSEQARRVSHVAALLADNGVVAIVALISPYREDRDRARAVHADLEVPFLEVWLDTPLAICEHRDPQQLYARARAGELHGLTGVDGPYQPPHMPELHLDGSAVEAAGQQLVEKLGERGLSPNLGTAETCRAFQ